MTEAFDGTYSIVASAIKGGSIGVATIANGKLNANDSSGTRYSGNVTDNGDGTVNLDLEVSFPPNTFGIWGTSESETIQTRQLSISIPQERFSDGKPHEIPNYQMTIILRAVSDQHAALAGPDGLKLMIGHLAQAQKVWERQAQHPA